MAEAEKEHKMIKTAIRKNDENIMRAQVELANLYTRFINTLEYSRSLGIKDLTGKVLAREAKDLKKKYDAQKEVLKLLKSEKERINLNSGFKDNIIKALFSNKIRKNKIAHRKAIKKFKSDTLAAAKTAAIVYEALLDEKVKDYSRDNPNYNRADARHDISESLLTETRILEQARKIFTTSTDVKNEIKSSRAKYMRNALIIGGVLSLGTSLLFNVGDIIVMGVDEIHELLSTGAQLDIDEIKANDPTWWNKIAQYIPGTDLYMAEVTLTGVDSTHESFHNIIESDTVQDISTTLDIVGGATTATQFGAAYAIDKVDSKYFNPKKASEIKEEVSGFEEA